MINGSRILLLLLTLVFLLDATDAEAGRRKRRRGRSSGRAHRVVKRPPPPDPRIAAREKLAQQVADKAFASCLSIGQKFGKNELDQNLQSRRCLLIVDIRVQNSVILLMQQASKPVEEISERQLDVYTKNWALKQNTPNALNDYDTLNLFYSIYTGKIAQFELKAEAAEAAAKAAPTASSAK